MKKTNFFATLKSLQQGKNLCVSLCAVAMLEILLLSYISIFCNQRNILCGSERSSVKHLSDPGAKLINYSPTSITIDSLLSLPLINVSMLFRDHNNFRLKDEFQTYKIKVYPKCWILENDNDYHLVCCDSIYKKSFIAEIPDPQCSESILSGHAAEYQVSRSLIDSIQYVTYKNWNYFRFKFYIFITGVLFHDKIHKVNGQSKNGIELHPVLSIGY